VRRRGEPNDSARRTIARIGVTGEREHVVLDPRRELGELLSGGGAAPSLRTAFEEREPELVLQGGHPPRNRVSVDLEPLRGGRVATRAHEL
jgi:hypothetical protein